MSIESFVQINILFVVFVLWFVGINNLVRYLYYNSTMYLFTALVTMPFLTLIIVLYEKHYASFELELLIIFVLHIFLLLVQLLNSKKHR